jgi:hypothetical protein
MTHYNISIKLLFLLVFLANSCSQNTHKKTKKEAPKEQINRNFTFEYNFDTLKGIYIGDFAGSDIRLVIRYISNKHAVGYNVHKGLQRNISGPVTIAENTIDIVLNEPGDNKFDGKYVLKINKKDFNINGHWIANNKQIKKEYFNLEKLSNHNNAAETDENVILTKYNFADYFYQIQDSLGKIKISQNGMCIYKYYPITDDVERKEQLISFKGSWSLKKDVLYIEWQKNSVFENEITSFEIIRNSDYLYDAVIKGENRAFYQNNF